jgi:hypothetical protein
MSMIRDAWIKYVKILQNVLPKGRKKMKIGYKNKKHLKGAFFGSRD